MYVFTNLYFYKSVWTYSNNAYTGPELSSCTVTEHFLQKDWFRGWPAGAGQSRVSRTAPALCVGNDRISWLGQLLHELEHCVTVISWYEILDPSSLRLDEPPLFHDSIFYRLIGLCCELLSLASHSRNCDVWRFEGSGPIYDHFLHF